MADKTIGSLPSVESVNDDSLIPAEQQGEAVKVTGAQFKSFAQKSVAGIVDQAKGYADQAAQSAAEAAESVTQIGDAVEQTQANKEAAQAAQAAAEAASQGVQEYANQAAQSASQASESAAEATLQAQGAAQSAESAQTAKNAAELAEADAQSAKTAAQLAQTSAEQSRDSAATSATTAQESATQAAQSASTAQQYSGNPPKPINGTWWIWNANSGSYEDTGIKSVLSIVKSYPSIADMEADVGNMHEGDLVIIATEDISDPDNSKLYVHNGLTWNYLSDLSGIEGVGIANIEQTGGTHAPGTTDTYTITLTDGSTYSFTVYNGADGQGAGDMLKSVYDPQNRNTDIFAYVDDAVSGVTITTDATPTQGSTNPVQSGGVYTALSQKQDNITGQQGQVVGFDASGKPVAQAAPDTGVISFNGRKGEVSPGDDDYSASMIKFTDGQTFQQKYDSGQLTGPAGANGSNGQDGSPGADGKDATINGENVLNLIEGKNISFEQSGSNLKINAEGGGIPVVTTGGTSSEYTATVPGITELKNGTLLIIVPHTTSTKRGVTLDVNGLGPIGISRYTSTKTNTFTNGASDDWLAQDFPVLLIYRETMAQWLAVSMTQPVAKDTRLTSEQVSATNVADAIDELAGKSGNGIPVVATGGTGAAYTATVPGIESLSNGAFFFMIPHVKNANSNPTLNVNGLGAKPIYLEALYPDLYSGFTANSKLLANKPFLMVYNTSISGWVVYGYPLVMSTEIKVLDDANYTTNQVRGISLQTSTPSRIPNGSIVGVYST